MNAQALRSRGRETRVGSPMTMDQITRADFAECLGERFEIEHERAVVSASLAEVTPLSSPTTPVPRAGGRESFSLTFLAPRTWRLPQGTCRVSHPKLGSLDVFLVAIGLDAKGMRLEAIFNFL